MPAHPDSMLAVSRYATAFVRFGSRLRRAFEAGTTREPVTSPGLVLLMAGALGAGLVLGPAFSSSPPPPGRSIIAAAQVAPALATDAARLDGPSAPRQAAAPRQAGTASTQSRPAPPRAGVPLTVRFPTVPGRTVDPGARVLAGIPATLALPARSGAGRRIVYGASAQHLWIVAADGQVLRDYPVTGRIDRPGPGRYQVYSMSPASYNPIAKVTFNDMVRFARGVTGAAIGFHSIPRWANGKPLQTPASLGLALGRGGCIRQTNENAAYLYDWVKLGDRVVVLA